MLLHVLTHVMVKDCLVEKDISLSRDDKLDSLAYFCGASEINLNFAFGSCYSF